MSKTCIPVDLCCEFKKNPIGIDEVKPRLSWKLADTRQGAMQTAYRILAASTRDALDKKVDLWDTGRVRTSQSLDIEYAGKKITSRSKVWWKVKIWDMEGKESLWSKPAFFELGLLKKNDWQAKWIGRPSLKNREGEPCPFLRKKFLISEQIASARVYVSARGLFELHINGRRVGKDYFTPGWTDYNKRIQYLTYDVTDLLVKGDNAVGAILGEGWFAGNLGWEKKRWNYGDQLSFLLQLEIKYSNGKIETICSDSDWKTNIGPITVSDIYNGETYDANRELIGWDTATYDDSSWDEAIVYPSPKAKLVAKRNPPVRMQEELKPQTVNEIQPGIFIFDLGQNMVGWARVRLKGQMGDKVKIRFAEMLNDDGTMYTANLRSAKSTDYYIFGSKNEVIWEPHFTFHGFRYVELSGINYKPTKDDLIGVVLHSEIPQIGKFECSDKLINRLQKNIQWGQKGNFLEVPTDCPQRDERLGWTGDAQVFVRTAAFNRDVASFFEKWCEDITDSQFPDGGVPHVVPNVLGKGHGYCAAWADAVIICPWIIYLCYGNKRILERQYKSMCKWVQWRINNSRNLINDSACFGDWLAIDIAEGNPGKSPTPRDLISTAYFAYTTGIVAKIAKILGLKADSKKYTKLYNQIKKAFNREFVSQTGRLVGDTQTAYALALGFDLLPSSKVDYAGKRLVKDIESRGFHLSTGFVGTPLLAPVLSKIGRTDVAYKLVLQKTYPGWIYSILQGATTMWERWNSYTKDKGFGDVGMNSFNHYAYGSIGEWLYNTVAGIDLDPECPGYKHIIFKPQPGEGINWAKAELQTRYGLLACKWKISGKKMQIKITVPPNTHATLILPGQKPKRIQAGIYEYEFPCI
ncbi:MAG TPA: family 78 glycoside hydrolase catalytic domain [Victivallales bacterium]|nr:family 78 glycoside hydrolase catalytic domain [Victivallales bacterium]HPO90288.1 family 78 glycoside hydrolase catalytic domain [Victivallales bacterium]